MKKTQLLAIFFLIALLLLINTQNGIAWIPGVHINSVTRSPSAPDVGEVVTITANIWYDRGPDYLAGDLYYKFNGGTEVKVTMTQSSNLLIGTIPGGSQGDIVEYKVHMRAEQLGELYSEWSPYSAGGTAYSTYVITTPTDIYWVSPASGTEITFGPIGDDITFNFNWGYLNLDDATLQVGDSTPIDILIFGTKQTTVDLTYGPDLEGSSIAAVLRGFIGGTQVATETRYFSFRRLDFSVHWETPSDGNTIAFSPTGLGKFNFTFSQGIDVDRVELFFNDTAMENVTSPYTLEFDHSSYLGSINATLKTFDSNNVEMASDTRTFIFRQLIFEVVWETPGENQSFVFGIGEDPIMFNLTFSKGSDVDYVKLELNGIDMGIVASPGSVIFNYNDTFHGIVAGVLKGFNATGSVLSNSTRYFKFDKMMDTRFEVLQENEIDLGSKLYLILHDPNGDDSVSSYEESTQLSLGIGCEITAGMTAGLEIGVEEEADFFGLFTTGFSASTKLSLSLEASLGFDAKLEMTDSTFLSSQDSSEAIDYIGPGYGDRYWGELWKLKYVFTIHYIEYYNGSQVYHDPHLWWGILRDAESYLSDANAPASWRAMNPVHQNYPEDEVEWLGGTLVTDGGGTYTSTHEVTTTNTMSQSISIGLESETKAKLTAGGAYVEGSLELSVNTKIYSETSVGNTITTSYTIHDDDPQDSIVQRVGIDKKFGTYIFKTESNYCSTSQPIEHNTIDYVPPAISHPTIIYDTDQDFKGPTPQDSPLVTVKIEEEGGMQDAELYYSIDNATSWRSTPLVEYQGQPGVWFANIPKQVNQTTVLWYLKAWDDRGNTAEKYDISGSYFFYKVGVYINPLQSPTPGFTLWTVMLSIAVGAMIVKKRKDR